MAYNSVLEFRDRRAGFEPAQHDEPPMVPVVPVAVLGEFGPHRDRREEIGRDARVDAGEPFARDPNDGERVSVDAHCGAHHARIAGEAPPPERMAQDHVRASAHPAVVLGVEHAAGGGLDAEHRGVVPRHLHAERHFRPRIARRARR